MLLIYIHEHMQRLGQAEWQHRNPCRCWPALKECQPYLVQMAAAEAAFRQPQQEGYTGIPLAVSAEGAPERQGLL